MREFFAMGGYGFYVWGSLGVTAALMVLEPLLVHRRRRQILQRLGRSRRQSRQGQAQIDSNNER
jgi:heme exporter protein D